MTQLQSKRIVTATALAEKHDVSVRTIYRDIRTLELSGIPIVTHEGKGYSIMEGYHLPPVVFTEDEANALITMEQLAMRNKDQSLTESVASAVEKIKAILRYSQKGNADLLSDRIAFGENKAEHRTSNNLMQIQSAIINFRVLKIDYLSREDKQSSREIEPFAVYSLYGNFLLIAFCRLRADFRVFRIDHIQELLPLDEKFEPHDLTMEQFYEQYIKGN